MIVKGRNHCLYYFEEHHEGSRVVHVYQRLSFHDSPGYSQQGLIVREDYSSDSKLGRGPLKMVSSWAIYVFPYFAYLFTIVNVLINLVLSSTYTLRSSTRRMKT